MGKPVGVDLLTSGIIAQDVWPEFFGLSEHNLWKLNNAKYAEN